MALQLLLKVILHEADILMKKAPIILHTLSCTLPMLNLCGLVNWYKMALLIYCLFIAADIIK